LRKYYFSFSITKRNDNEKKYLKKNNNNNREENNHNKKSKSWNAHNFQFQIARLRLCLPKLMLMMHGLAGCQVQFQMIRSKHQHNFAFTPFFKESF
jgi:hypothetical protein